VSFRDKKETAGQIVTPNRLRQTLKADAGTSGEAEFVDEEGVIVDAAIRVERRARVPEHAIADVQSYKRTRRCADVHAAAKIDRQQRTSRRERAGKRRWKDEDAREWLRRFGNRHDTGPDSRERP
jgi:hypothetical protein